MIALSRFVSAANTLLPNASAFFLATDDPSVVEQTQAHVQGPPSSWGAEGVPWLVNLEEDRLNGTGTRLQLPGTPWIAAFHCTSPAVRNITRCTLDMIATIAILSECDAMVGTASSNLLRLAFQLKFASSADPASAERCMSLDLPERGIEHAEDHCHVPPCPPFWFPGP